MTNKVHGIYTLSSVENKSAVRIKHLENIQLEEHHHVFDTCVDDFQITKNVVGRTYACNILDKYLMSSKTQPVLYTSVIYKRPLGLVLLYNIYLYFTIESDVTSSKDFLNNELKGKFNLYVVIEDQRKELDKQIDTYPGNDKMLKILRDFTTSDEMIELVNILVESENEKIRQKYADNFNNLTIPKATISLNKDMEN